MHWQDEKFEGPDKPDIPKAPKTRFWCDSRGVPLSESELKAQSKNWSMGQWETYLDDMEVAQREDVGLSKDRRLLLEEFETTEDGTKASVRDPYEEEFRDANIVGSAPLTQIIRAPRRRRAGEGETVDELEPTDEIAEPLVAGPSIVDRILEARLRIIERALWTLTQTQRVIISLIFWDGRTEMQVVRLIGKSRRSVRTWRDRAFVKLRVILSPVFRKGEKGRVSLSQIKKGLRGRKRIKPKSKPKKRNPKPRFFSVSA